MILGHLDFSTLSLKEQSTLAFVYRMCHGLGHLEVGHDGFDIDKYRV